MPCIVNERMNAGFNGRESIEEALRRLNERLVYAESKPLSLVICGGASLNLMGWVVRSTSDVDILGMLSIQEGKRRELVNAKRLSQEFDEMVASVGRELGLAEDWLNFGPAPLLEFGLPDGLVDRVETIGIGDCLTIHAISRWDQIHLKLYAALDPGSRVETHLGDLLDLEPTEEEAEAAINWLMNRPVGVEFRERVKQLLESIGHERVAETI